MCIWETFIAANLYVYIIISTAGLGTIIPWSGSRERLVSLGTDKERGSPSALEHERAISATPRRNSMLMETSPPSSLMFAASPPNMEGPIMFVAPELSEETLMDVSEVILLVIFKISFQIHCDFIKKYLIHADYRLLPGLLFTIVYNNVYISLHRFNSNLVPELFHFFYHISELK